MFAGGEFSQTLQPKQGFVSFLFCIANVADEICLGLGPLRGAVVCRDGSRRPDNCRRMI
jgi:hypothetical protein